MKVMPSVFVFLCLSQNSSQVTVVTLGVLVANQLCELVAVEVDEGVHVVVDVEL